jgi:hypothetical protein
MLFGPDNEKNLRRKYKFIIVTVIVCGNLESIVHDARNEFSVGEAKRSV